MKNPIPGLNKFQPDRGGYTVLEMVISLAMLSSVLASASALIFHWMKGDASFRHQLLHMNNVDRLARDLRRDAHNSNQWEPEGTSFVVQDGTKIQYVINDNLIERLESKDDKVSRRQQYIMLTGWSARWKSTKESPQTIQLELVQVDSHNAQFVTESDQEQQTVKMAIVAAIGTTAKPGGDPELREEVSR